VEHFCGTESLFLRFPLFEFDWVDHLNIHNKEHWAI
jgi:hypothetical protein